jgi:hypothetical protein
MDPRDHSRRPAPELSGTDGGMRQAGRRAAAGWPRGRLCPGGSRPLTASWDAATGAKADPVDAAADHAAIGRPDSLERHRINMRVRELRVLGDTGPTSSSAAVGFGRAYSLPDTTAGACFGEARGPGADRACAALNTSPTTGTSAAYCLERVPSGGLVPASLLPGGTGRGRGEPSEGALGDGQLGSGLRDPGRAAPVSMAGWGFQNGFIARGGRITRWLRTAASSMGGWLPWQ